MANIGLSALAAVLPILGGLMSPVFGDPSGGIAPPPGAGGPPPGMPPGPPAGPAPGSPPLQAGPVPPPSGAGSGPGMPLAKDPRAITENDIQQVEAFMALLKHRIAAHRKTYLHSSSIGRYGQQQGV